MNAACAVGDTARLRHRDEELKIDQIESHGDSSRGKPFTKPSLRATGSARRTAPVARNDEEPSAFDLTEGCLRNLQIVPIIAIGQCARHVRFHTAYHRRRP